MYLAGLDPRKVYTTAVHKLGTVLFDARGRGFMFVEADAAITAGMCCIVHGDFGAEGVDDTNAAVDAGYGKRCGVALVAIASGSFGWLCVYGTGSDILLSVAASCADTTRLRPTATAGVLDDTTTHTEPYVKGMVTTVTATGADLHPAIVRWPYLEKNLTE